MSISGSRDVPRVPVNQNEKISSLQKKHKTVEEVRTDSLKSKITIDLPPVSQKSDKISNPLASSQLYEYRSSRPSEIQSEIDSNFEKLAKLEDSGWGLFNGRSKYNLCGVDDHLLAKQLILQAYPARKEFVFMDIGAGNFSWSHALSDYINNEPQFPKDIQVKILSLRGEQNNEEKIIQTGVCEEHYLGEFPVENLLDTLEKQNFALGNKVDLIVSSWCFRHLVDPVGTLFQTFELLNPEGLMALDGFMFLNGNEPREALEKNSEMRMIQLISSITPQFLIKKPEDIGFNELIIQKPTQLPELKYSHIIKRELSPHYAIQFASSFEGLKREEVIVPDEKTIVYGSHKLYKHLKIKDLEWNTIQSPDINEYDETLGGTQLHQAIQEQNKEKVIELLDLGARTVVYNSKGYTPLAAAIMSGNLEIAEILLQKGANVKAGGPINNVLYVAFKTKNYEVVQLLVKYGTELNETQQNELDNFLNNI